MTTKPSTIVRMTTTKTYDFLNRLLSISSAPSAASVVSFSYAYNNASQRVRTTLADGSYWIYEYDNLGQVKTGKRYWSDNTPVAGQQFAYGFDDIGNRTSTKAGGNSVGTALRAATYSANTLNQITQRDVPGAVDIIGAATATATSVTVNDQSAYRRGEYYQLPLSLNNASSAQWTSVTNLAVQSGTTNTVIGNTFLPQTPEVFSYDADGNLTNDGRWVLTWDAENRLTKIESQTSGLLASKRKLTLDYDWGGRLIRRTEYNGASGSYLLTNDVKFLSDGLHCIAELNAANNALQRSYLWGSDVSGTMTAAGGVGGLLEINSVSNGVHFCAYDGNGNVTALVKGTDGTSSANYEYGPFGEVIRATGPMAKENPYRFSTKRTDDATDLAHYEFRVYRPATGRWLSRDPSGESHGNNLYAHVSNNPINTTDILGLWPADVHHDIIRRWLDASYDKFPWSCCIVPVRHLLMQGSDEIDGGGDFSGSFFTQQALSRSYQHAMRAPGQSVYEAQDLYSYFLDANIQRAEALSDQARARNDCHLIFWAVQTLGRAYHAFSDNLSPAHAVFQEWNFDPTQVALHKQREQFSVYENMQDSVKEAVKSEFQDHLFYILAISVE